MKRVALLCLAAVALLPGRANAQLSMQMGNNWTFTFSGNINAFYVFSAGSVDQAGTITGGLTSTDKASRIRTGLLPSEFALDATGKVEGLDLGVHFGIYPQIQNASVHDNFGNGTQAGAQIDLRQVYLTVGGSWGQIAAGRNLSLFGRQNILTDMTLFGTGPSGTVVGGGGTTLGRIGYGYIYPNFNAQMTYSTPANKPAQLSVGIFDPDIVNAGYGTPSATFSGTRMPRIEAEVTWTGNFGGTAAGGNAPANKLMLWANGMLQHTNSVPNDFGAGSNPGITSTGIGGGAKVDISGLSLVGSGYFASGVGTTLYFTPLAVDPTSDTRNSFGFIGQATYAITNTKWIIGASYGESDLQQTDNDKTVGAGANLVKRNAAAVASLTNQVTKELKWVGEYDYIWSSAFSGAKIHSNQVSTGLMLFF